MSDWSPQPFPTYAPTKQQTLDKTTKNEFITIGISLIVISIVAILIILMIQFQYKIPILKDFKPTFISYSIKKQSSLYATTPELILWYSTAVAIFVTGITLISVELASNTLDEVKLARTKEQISFCVFFFIIISMIVNSTFHSEQNFSFDLIVYSACFGGAIACLAILSYSGSELAIKDTTFFTISLIAMLLGIAILVTGIWYKYKEETNISILVFGVIVTITFFILTMVALSQSKEEKINVPIPFIDKRIFPKDLNCSTITNTITQQKLTGISRLRFVLNINYLSSSGDPNNPLAPMDLISITKEDKSQAISIKYANKKLFFKISGIPTEYSIDVVPQYSNTPSLYKFYTSLVFVTYEDTDNKKYGSIEIFDENSSNQPIFINLWNQGSPTDWGNVTIEIFKNKANNNADVIGGMQICNQLTLDQICTVPLGYKLCLFVILLFITSIIIYILLKYVPIIYK